MRESDFNTEVKKSLIEYGAWAYKIADSPVSRTLAITRFTPEKPFDIVALYKGTAIAIESKLRKGGGKFGMKDLRPSQIENLERVHLNGGRSFVFLNVRIPKKRINHLQIFPWAQFKFVCETGEGYKIDILKTSTTSKSGIWDFKNFLTTLRTHETRAI